MGFVSIAIIGAAPPSPGLIVNLKGRTLLLPDWKGDEWRWYMDLALAIANKQETRNDTAITASKDRAIATAKSVRVKLLDDARVSAANSAAPGSRYSPDEAFAIYDAAVRLVIASNAAGAGASKGAMAVEAFKERLLEMPEELRDKFISMLQDKRDLLFKVLPKKAAEILKDVFDATAAGLGLSLSHPLVIAGILLGGYYLYNRFGKHKEE